MLLVLAKSGGQITSNDRRTNEIQILMKQCTYVWAQTLFCLYIAPRMSFLHVILHAPKTFRHDRSYNVFWFFFAMYSVMGLAGVILHGSRNGNHSLMVAHMDMNHMIQCQCLSKPLGQLCCLCCRNFERMNLGEYSFLSPSSSAPYTQLKKYWHNSKISGKKIHRRR